MLDSRINCNSAVKKLQIKTSVEKTEPDLK